jgi:hypothetical protein
MSFNEPKALALAIVFASLVAGWLLRFENLGSGMHRNRISGEVCHISEECWFSSKYSSLSWLAISRAKATEQLRCQGEDVDPP